MLKRDLHDCDRLRNPITLPRTGGDEIDQIIGRIRSYIRTPQEQLQAAREQTDLYLTAQSDAQSAIRQITAELSGLSALTTGLNGRIAAYDQVMLTTEESLRILELKTERLQDQGDTQAVQVTQTTAAIEEIHASVGSITERADSRRQSALELRESASRDEQSIRQSRADIVTIAEEIAGVSEILASINAISEQTSQLSLNAFIESAHGGENNKGFEVVASEIRQLADSTAENADGIRTLLHRIDDRIREARFFSDKTLHTFHTSVKVINEFADSMEGISGLMQYTNTTSTALVEEAQTISSRADGIQELSASVHKLVAEGRERLEQTRGISRQLEEFVTRTDSAVRALEQDIATAKQHGEQTNRQLRSLQQQLLLSEND